MMAEARRNDDPPNSNGSDGSNGDGLWRIEPMPPELIDSPLDFIFAEHLRQREAATMLLAIADGNYSKQGLTHLIEFLENDFALHIGDEEVVLFPVLRERCLKEDNIDALIERLNEEHREDENTVEDVISILLRRIKGHMISAVDARRLRVFAEHIRQHLALENGVMLPIARVRLSEDDLASLADMLKKRRA